MTLSRIKIFLLATTVYLLAFNANGQNIIEGYWGFKAGANFNKISKITFDNSIKPGFNFGVFATFRINDNFSVQHEVLYGNRGISLSLPGGTSYIKTFSFVDLPWILNYHFNDNFHVTAGLQASVFAYFKKPTPDSIVYNKDNVNSIDFSYLLGAGFILDNNFGFGVRFNGSVVPTFDLDETKGKNYMMQVYLMYAINKRKGKKF